MNYNEEESDRRMKIIGQNGPCGIHYDREKTKALKVAKKTLCCEQCDKDCKKESEL